MKPTEAVSKREPVKMPGKNSTLNGIRMHGPAIVGALLYQLSHQANWELVIIRFRDIYTNCLPGWLPKPIVLWT